MKRAPKDVASSVHQRLLNRAKETKRPFDEMLQHFAMERFLYRLSRSRHADKLVIKGALMLTIWKVDRLRPTRDIDVLARMRNDLDAVLGLTRDVCVQHVEPDGLAFDADTVEGERIVEDAAYGGIRVRFRGRLGAARISMQLDVGFGDPVVPAVVTVEYPSVLDLPAPRLAAYTKESFIAEKFEAMMKLGALNSRMKDFYDVWLLSNQFGFDGSTLSAAILETFSTRGTPMPSRLAAWTQALLRDDGKSAQWRGFIRRSRLEDAPRDFEGIVLSIAAFLEPVVRALTAGGPFKKAWRTSGRWST